LPLLCPYGNITKIVPDERGIGINDKSLLNPDYCQVFPDPSTESPDAPLEDETEYGVALEDNSRCSQLLDWQQVHDAFERECKGKDSC